MKKTTFLAACTLLVAATAWALTVAEVQNHANVLYAAFQALEGEIDACPGGECAEAQDILDAQDALEADNAGLHVDRGTLNPCTSCGQLDQTMAAIDTLQGVLQGKTYLWDESM